MKNTFDITFRKKLHEIAAATTFGREDINYFPNTILPVF